jgi:hypothetical protein
MGTGMQHVLSVVCAMSHTQMESVNEAKVCVHMSKSILGPDSKYAEKAPPPESGDQGGIGSTRLPQGITETKSTLGPQPESLLHLCVCRQNIFHVPCLMLKAAAARTEVDREETPSSAFRFCTHLLQQARQPGRVGTWLCSVLFPQLPEQIPLHSKSLFNILIDTDTTVCLFVCLLQMQELEPEKGCYLPRLPSW